MSFFGNSQTLNEETSSLLDSLNKYKFLNSKKAYFGIKEDGAVFETIKENGKIDQRIKALIHQDGKAVTNAQIRKIKELLSNNDMKFAKEIFSNRFVK